LARFWNTWTSHEMSLKPINNHTSPSRTTKIDSISISELSIWCQTTTWGGSVQNSTSTFQWENGMWQRSTHGTYTAN